MFAIAISSRMKTTRNSKALVTPFGAPFETRDFLKNQAVTTIRNTAAMNIMTTPFDMPH